MDFVKIGEVSRLLRIHPTTLYRYERQGIVSPLRGRGGVRLYAPRDVRRLRRLLAPKVVKRNSRRCAAPRADHDRDQ